MNMAKSSGKPIYLVALMLFLGGMGFLMYSGFSEGSVYFLNVSEALASPPERLKSARLFGTVAAEGLTVADNGRSVRFQLEDRENPSQCLWVSYSGALPDTFKVGAEVIVEGGAAPNTDFSAKSLVTKCPSKYQKEHRKG